eukprot:CAMPEP_0176230244 /NCGR_PEP_ID=MMETSP0121_2-20121125/24198_1 /TAXON_ID=160619 /ORGANISM="Kryptoperidinium foliaceum, Strain CCMP 1326" /LENGTH=179 /DNA_ID=CAMNT_0017569579 /DNA_START=66 /DNA_END=603 /DNA_ORIENTATION=-
MRPVHSYASHARARKQGRDRSDATSRVRLSWGRGVELVRGRHRHRRLLALGWPRLQLLGANLQQPVGLAWRHGVDALAIDGDKNHALLHAQLLRVAARGHAEDTHGRAQPELEANRPLLEGQVDLRAGELLVFNALPSSNVTTISRFASRAASSRAASVATLSTFTWLPVGPLLQQQTD